MELTRLRTAIVRGDLPCPFEPVGLMRCGLTELSPKLAPLQTLQEAAVLTVLDAVIAERVARPGAELDVVWTGPDLQQGVVRSTAAVVRELLASAQREVVLGGCYFSSGAAILQPLHTAMRERGVRVLFCMDVGDSHRLQESALNNAQRCAAAFLHDNWPFGQPLPAFYYDPRGAVCGTLVKLHAKCIVVDEERALVTSANFTHLGHTENIEAGVLVRDSAFASKLAQQFRFLIECERLLPCPIPANVSIIRRQVPEGWEEAAELVPTAHAALVEALIAAGVPGPEDYGTELSARGRVLAQTSLMHWGEGPGRLSIVDAASDSLPAHVDGQVIAVSAASDVAQIARQVAASLRRDAQPPGRPV